MEIWTDRLHLREYVEEDFEDMLAYESDPLVVQYVCYGPYSRDECLQQLSYHIDHQTADPRVYYNLGIVLPQEKRLIGWCGLEMIDMKNREAELGYALNSDYWGRGFMTEATRSMLQVGFGSMGLHRIFANCNTLNTGSIRVLEKLGMRYEGCFKEQKWCRGQWRDTVVYAILEKEFASQNSHSRR